MGLLVAEMWRCCQPSACGSQPPAVPSLHKQDTSYVSRSSRACAAASSPHAASKHFTPEDGRGGSSRRSQRPRASSREEGTLPASSSAAMGRRHLADLGYVAALRSSDRRGKDVRGAAAPIPVLWGGRGRAHVRGLRHVTRGQVPPHEGADLAAEEFDDGKGSEGSLPFVSGSTQSPNRQAFIFTALASDDDAAPLLGGDADSEAAAAGGQKTGESRSWLDELKDMPRRYVIVGLCFIAFLLCNMDRVNMSIAILPMSAEYGWSPTTVGIVQSSFFWGYLLTQIAGGILADKIGGKVVLGFGVIWWSLATMATPIAAQIGLPALLFARACMGVGEGVAMPAMNNLLSRWVPVYERSRSLALVYSGMYLGSVTGLAVSPGMIHQYGWPSVFYGFGSLGALWFVTWQRFASSSPVDDPKISEGERNMILANTASQERVEKIPWKLLLSKAPVWAIIVCHFCHNWGTFILLTWMPTYYNQVLGFNLMESGIFSVLPWLTMSVAANVGGWIADSLIQKGYSVTFVRKAMQTVGFLGPAFCLTALGHIRGNPVLAVLCMMGSQGMDAFSQSGLYSNHQDIGPRYAGVLLGLSNTAGVLAGVLGTAATGYILQQGSWDDVFKVAVGLYLVGTVIWNLFATGEKIFD